MVIGLFLSYFVYDCMSLLIRQSFGIATGFVLDGGWFVTNMIGVIVLVNIFVMLHVTAALMSFRMVTLIPHHLPRLIGLAPAQSGRSRGLLPAGCVGAGWFSGGWSATGPWFQREGDTGRCQPWFATKFASRPAGYIGGPSGQGAEGAMDSTLRGNH